MPSDKIDKKRKRHSDRHERPSKKPALELQDLPPLSASLVEDHSELAPVIGTAMHSELEKYMANSSSDNPRRQPAPKHPPHTVLQTACKRLIIVFLHAQQGNRLV